MSKTLKPLRYPGDSPKMNEAINWLEKHGYSVSRPTKWQLKIGPFNFYPDKGTIHQDRNHQPHPDRGLAALQRLLPRPALNLSADEFEIVLLPADRG